MTDLSPFLNYQPPENLMTDRIVLITGAGDGIGKAVAMALAQHGATLVLVGRTQSKLERLYDQIEAAGHPTPAIFRMDLATAKAEDYQALADAVREEFGRLDGLLHNAGELGSRTPLHNYPPGDWDKVMQVNVTAPFLLTRAMMPLIKLSRDGRVVFTGSSVGVKGRAYWGAYAVSKGATETLMQVLADELEGSSTRVNSINPGATRTGMRSAAFPAENPIAVTAAQDIVNRYLFLLGPDSRGWHGLQLDAQPK